MSKLNGRVNRLEQKADKQLMPPVLVKLKRALEQHPELIPEAKKRWPNVLKDLGYE